MLTIFSYTSIGTQTEAIAANDSLSALTTSPLSAGDLAGNSIGPLATSPINNGLMLWYDMNQTGLVISDLSGNRNNGIAIGAKYVKLPSGAGSRSFNGASDYISAPNSASISQMNSLTVEVLFKADQINRPQTLLDKSLLSAISKGYSLQVNSNNRLQFILYNSSGAKSTLNGPGISAGKWYHVVATASENTITLYVNGVKAATGAYNGMAPSQTNMVIGHSALKSQSHFDGSISTVRIYNRALTNLEVLNNYNADLWRTGSWPSVTPTATPTVTIKPTATPTPTVIPTLTPAPVPTPVSSVQWAGHTWSVTDYKGGAFTSNNVWVDSGNQLHMKLVYDGQWHNFNLIQQDNVGYGTYRWTVASDVSGTLSGDPGFLFSPFLFDNSNSREMDVQMSKWGSPGLGYNTNWTVWTPAGPKVQTSQVGGAGNTWTLEWMPDHIKFSVQGPNQPYKEWVFTDTSGIPPNTGSMKSLLYIGQYQNAAPPNNAPNYQAEVVLSGYTYTPYTPTPTATPKPTVTPTPTPTPTPVPTATPAPSPVSSVQWAGHTWDVTNYDGSTFTSDNVWVDSSNRLHMKLVYDGRWHNFNLIQQDNVGYGTYKWTVASDVSSTLSSDSSFLFSPFLFDNSNGKGIDVQMSKWGNPSLGYNTNWTVWTPTGPRVQSNQVVGAGNTWTLEWMPDHIKFSVQGPNQSYKDWVFTDTSGIPPSTGSMKNLLYIGQVQNTAPPNNAPNYQAEVVLNGYTYTPYTPTTTPKPTTTPTPTATPRPTTTPGKSPPTPPGPVSTIYWEGYNWELTHYDGTTYTTDNVRVDENGWLHMNLIYKDGKWTMYNMIREGWAHYGTYTYNVQTDIHELQDYQDGGNPGLLWAAYMFDNTIPEKNYGEIDIELSKWGNPNCPSDSDWTIWSNDHHVEYNHFVGHSNTWTIEWMPTYIKFSVVGPEQPYKEYIFSDQSHLTPDTGNMKTYLGFYQFQGAPPPGGLSYYNAEVIVTGITYTPYAGNAAGQALPVPTSTLSRA